MMTQAEGGGVKQQNKKKQKKESAWRSEGPKDPFAMVCVLMCTHDAHNPTHNS